MESSLSLVTVQRNANHDLRDLDGVVPPVAAVRAGRHDGRAGTDRQQDGRRAGRYGRPAAERPPGLRLRPDQLDAVAFLPRHLRRRAGDCTARESRSAAGTEGAEGRQGGAWLEQQIFRTLELKLFI